MKPLSLYSQVRLKRLLRNPQEYDGWKLNKRNPEVGDIGNLIDILHAKELPDHYIVEKTESDGSTTWLGEFVAEELEPA